MQIGVCQSLEIPIEVSFRMRMAWTFKASGESVPLDTYDKIEMVFQEKKKGPNQVVVSSLDSSPGIVIDSEDTINIVVDKDLFSSLTDTGIYRLTLFNGEEGVRLLYGTYKLV